MGLAVLAFRARSGYACSFIIPGEHHYGRTTGSTAMNDVSSALAAVDQVLRLLQRQGYDYGERKDDEGSALLDQFSAGDAARLRQLIEPVPVLQADLTVDCEEQAWRNLMAGSLEAIGTELRRIGLAEVFWFVRKQPGIRLRIEGSSPPLRNALGDMLERCRVDKLISAWSWGCYEPELYLFGGPAGLALAHRFFTADSFAVLGYYRLRLQQLIELTPTEFSFWATGCLWTQVVADRFELWDAWCRLEGTGRVSKSAKIADCSIDNLPPAVIALAEVVRSPALDHAGLAAPVTEVLARYVAEAATIAVALRETAARGELDWFPRQLLPFWLIHHWNRMGFAATKQEELAQWMIVALNPHLRTG
jgi:thiopeptide-type bacteriocin biosynthesis protein